jgi:tetratricopeptide (TPR) repeat protein
MAVWTRAFGIAIGTALTACGTHELRVASGDSLAVRTQPAAAPDVQSTPTARDDEADYGLALLHRTEGNAALRAALSVYVDAHPDSPRTPDALIALGDLEINKGIVDPGRLALATFYYDAAQRSAKRLPAPAAYELAHIRWRRDDFDGALELLKQVIDQRRNAAPAGAALRDLPALLAVSGGPAKAYAFLRLLSNGQPTTSSLADLAEAYDALGKYPECRAVYDELRHRDPIHACRWTVFYRHASLLANAATPDADLAKCPP